MSRDVPQQLNGPLISVRNRSSPIEPVHARAIRAFFVRLNACVDPRITHVQQAAFKPLVTHIIKKKKERMKAIHAFDRMPFMRFILICFILI